MSGSIVLVRLFSSSGWALSRLTKPLRVRLHQLLEDDSDLLLAHDGLLMNGRGDYVAGDRLRGRAGAVHQRDGLTTLLLVVVLREDLDKVRETFCVDEKLALGVGVERVDDGDCLKVELLVAALEEVQQALCNSVERVAAQLADRRIAVASSERNLKRKTMTLVKFVCFTKSTSSCNVKFAFALLSSSSTRRGHAMRKMFNVSANR